MPLTKMVGDCVPYCLSNLCDIVEFPPEVRPLLPLMDVVKDDLAYRRGISLVL